MKTLPIKIILCYSPILIITVVQLLLKKGIQCNIITLIQENEN